LIPSYFLSLPQTSYEEALKLQHKAVAARVDGRLAEELVILLEHPPVFTLGRRGGLENLIVDEAFLQDRGIKVRSVERGGNITYHGPGQLVVYPIFNLHATRIKVVDFVTALEEAMARTAARWGVDADGDPHNRGVWAGRRKLGSIGITVRRGVTFHGLALNVNTDLSPFQWMNPCGIKDCEMTSLARETGVEISMQDARDQMKRRLAEILGLDAREVDMDFIKRLIQI
jgi:lipoate-protein ligase B